MILMIKKSPRHTKEVVESFFECTLGYDLQLLLFIKHALYE